MISVVIIFLDAEPFLKDAVDSVLGQTTGDWELLLVDDGSRDGSTAIARDYAAAQPNIRYLQHDGHRNRGMSASRNLGIRHARGAAVAFLDADDVWRPEHLATLQSVLDRHPAAGLAYTRPTLWDSASGATVPEPAPATGMEPLPADAPIPPPQALLRFLTRTAPTPCPSGMLVRRELLERVGGFEERFTGLYEDQAFVAKACLVSPVTVSPASTLLYRQHPDSCYARARRSGQREAARRTFLEWFARYLRETGVDGEIGQAVRRERAQLGPPSITARILRRAARAVRACAACASATCDAARRSAGDGDWTVVSRSTARSSSRSWRAMRAT
jgi:glycosyltransferase involved in cell wall biosynthesis